MPDHVSRETAPTPPPPAAKRMFGEALPLAVRYAEMLATDGVHRGLIGPREAERLWERHLLNCVAVAPLIPRGATVCDVGSGAGLPGVVVALARPDVHMILLDSLRRRTEFLAECVARLALPHVEVVRGRAEDQAGRLKVDVVLARAVAPLPRLTTWALPLLVPGGLLLALKGQGADDELAAAVPQLRRLGAISWEVRRVGAPLVDPPSTVVVVAVGERLPRGHSARRAQGRSSGDGGASRRREG